jgi:small redox-active disulfide protein 2
MIIKVLGSGCANCVRLEANVNEALAASGIEDATVEKVTDYADIAAYGIMSTPGLVVDEKVLVSGRVPAASEVAQLIASAR